MTNSLRLRLLVGSTIAIGVTLAVLSIATFLLMRRALTADFDLASLAKARALVSAVEQKGQKVTVESDQMQMEFSRTDRPEYFSIRLDDGTELARSASLGDGRLAEAATGSQPQFRNTVLPDGRHGRLVTLRFNPRLEHEDDDEHTKAPSAVQSSVLVLARDTDDIDTNLSHLKGVLASLSGAAIAVSEAGLLLVVGAALRPLKRLACDIESFPENDLSRRLSEGDAPIELRSIVERFNGLLARLEDAFQRERSFAADVAHELRTPISGLHTTLQVGRSRRREPEGYEAIIDKCLKMTGGIGAVVETLLLLARADAGQLRVKNARVDLSELIDECWNSVRQRASNRGLRVEIAIHRPWAIQNDFEKLAMILNNLFDNAVSYTDQGGEVWIKTERKGDSEALAVTNTGSVLSDDEVNLVFDRFWRSDRNRSETGVHCGLGLSLCQRLATLLRVGLSAEVLDGKFRVLLWGFARENVAP